LVGDLVLHQFIRETTGCASYLISSEKTGKSILVDPLTDIEQYETFLRDHNIELVALVDTHTHADHLSGVRSFSKLYSKAIIAMHESSPAVFSYSKLKDGYHLENLIGASTTIKVIYTPGHATDHICMLLETPGRNKLISGDCLFIGDVGRTDLGRGDNDTMYESLFHKILLLPPETEVYPAHLGAKHFLASAKVSTTVGTERDTNPALQVRSKEEFVKYMTEGWPPKPAHYQEIIEINLGRKPIADAPEGIIRA
jgi:glyoxylase-like metal-dependent hydrolase (beta-lactamase superfamily II)